MQTHLYRFKIVKALANAVFEAKDEATHTTVTLYEWTPEPSQREGVRVLLAELAARLDCEVFSADASLYLVASTLQQSSAALEELRRYKLFTGVWLNETPKPPPPPPPAAVRPSVKKASGTGQKWFAIAAGIVVALVIGLVVGAEFANSSQSSSQKASLREAYSKLRDANEETERVRQSLYAASNRADAAEQHLKEFDGVHVLRVANDCNRPIHAAVRYKSFQGTWMTQGWFTVPAKRSILVGTSPVEEFYVYGKDDGNGIWHDLTGTAKMTVVVPDFTYGNGEGPAGSAQEIVNPFHDVASPSTLNCDVK